MCHYIGVTPSNLKIATCNRGNINIEQFVDIVTGLKKEILIIGGGIRSLEEKHDGKLILNDNVFLTNMGVPVILQGSSGHKWSPWPCKDRQWFHDSSLVGVLIEEFSKARGISMEKVKEISDIDVEHEDELHDIGTINGVKVKGHAYIIRSD